jgi:hypothetical protein
MSKANDISEWGQYAPKRKNLIINGGFSIAQRGTSFNSLTASTWTLDRWRYTEQSTATVTVTQPSLTAGEAAGSHYWFMAVNVADAALTGSDFNMIIYRVEGNDSRVLNWNRTTQAAKKDVTVSFWHAHTLTGTHCVSIRNDDNTRSYVAEYTQTSANTWQYTTITIPAPTDGTWLVGNDVGLTLNFCFAVGTTYATSNADTWESSNYLATPNQVNNMNNTANRIRLAGIQMEVGTDATDFEYRHFSEELALCQRYYEKSFDYATAPVDGIAGLTRTGAAINTTTIYAEETRFAVAKRIDTYSLVFYRGSSTATAARWGYYNSGWQTPTTAMVIVGRNTGSFSAHLGTTSTTLGYAHLLEGHWTADAELP